MKDELENFQNAKEIPKSQRKIVMTVGDIDCDEKYSLKEDSLQLLKEKLYEIEEFNSYLKKSESLFVEEIEEVFYVMNYVGYPHNLKFFKFLEKIFNYYNEFILEKINQYRNLNNEHDALHKKNSQLKEDNIVLSKLVLELKKSNEKFKFENSELMNNKNCDFLPTNSSMVHIF